MNKENNHSKKIQEHFNSQWTDYDASCDKVVPENRKLQEALVDAIPYEREANVKLLDLGVGTGLTTLNVLRKFPNFQIDGIDFSSEMLKQSRERLGKFNNYVNLIEADFTNSPFNTDYDCIFSAITLHNLENSEKSKLFKKIYGSLKEGGFFINADFISFEDNRMRRKTEEYYENFLKENLSGKELDHWILHFREDDIPATMNDQFKWLKEAGFSSMETILTHQNLAVYYAVK